MAKRELVQYDFLAPQEMPWTGGSFPRDPEIELELRKDPDNWDRPVGVIRGTHSIAEIREARHMYGMIDSGLVGTGLGYMPTEGRSVSLVLSDVNLETRRTNDDPMLVVWEEDPESGGIKIKEDITQKFINHNDGPDGDRFDLRLRSRGQGPEGQRPAGPERG